MGRLKESTVGAAGSSYSRGSAGGRLGSFRRVSRRAPCPVCEKTDWCLVHRERALALCMRMASDRPARGNSGGWLHVLDASARLAHFDDGPAQLTGEQRASAEVRDTAYRALLARLPLAPHHRADLEARKLGTAGYGTLPLRGRAAVASAVVEQLGDAAARGVPGLVVKGDAGRRYWTLGGSPGLLIPVHDAAGRIVAVKIRADDARGGNRYRYWTSAPTGGAAAESAVHVPPGFSGPCATVRITEGELKAATATAATGVLTLSVPGVSTWRLALPVVEQLGARRVRVAFDADHASNTTVARALVELLEALDVAGCDVVLETWDAAHKGVDDALVAGAPITTREGAELQRYAARLRASLPAVPASEPSRPVRQVMERLPAPPERTTLDAARELVQRALEGAALGARKLVRVSPGAGKSTAMVAAAAARAAAGERVALLVRDYAALAAVHMLLVAAGVVPRIARGVLQVTGPDGAPVCAYPGAVAAVQACGISPRMAVCRGAFRGYELGPACERHHDCAAADPWSGPADAPVTLAVHAMAPFVLGDEQPFGLVVVDETPGDVIAADTFAAEDLRAALDTRDVQGEDRRLSLELLAGALLHGPGVDLGAGLARYVAAEGAEAWSVWCARGRPDDPAAALDTAREDLRGRPLLPRREALAALKRPGARARDDARWRVYRALAGHAHAGNLTREGDTVHVAWSAPAARALAGATGAVVVLDGTADLPTWTQALEREPQLVDATVQERAAMHRTVIPTRDATRKAWCPGGVVRWTPGLRGAVRSVVEQLVASVPREATVAWASFRPVATALQTAWESGQGEGAELLEPLRAHGAVIRWTYYGASDTRGANVHDDCDATVSLGDPRPNVGRTRAAGIDPEALAAASLGQWHDRLRGVVRARELWSAHAGTTVPAGQWDRLSTTVTEPRAGRPVAGVDCTALVARLVERFGSLSALALAAGVSRRTLSTARQSPVSAPVAARLRTAGEGAQTIPVQRRERMDGGHRIDCADVPKQSPWVSSTEARTLRTVPRTAARTATVRAQPRPAPPTPKRPRSARQVHDQGDGPAATPAGAPAVAGITPRPATPPADLAAVGAEDFCAGLW